MEGRQAQFNILPISPGERATVQWQRTIQAWQALPGPSGPRGVGVSRGGEEPRAFDGDGIYSEEKTKGMLLLLQTKENI